MQVFVVLFNTDGDNAGIHTLKVGDRNVVLMFENEDDAVRYGLMLEAQDFPSPSVESIDAEEIEDFCEGAGYDCALVEAGMLAVPPESNVDNLDWDPDATPESSFPPTSGTSAAETSATETTTSAMSDSEMDQIRKRLEGLL